MNLENQVVSLELSKKLKELGVKQESIFTWVAMEDTELELCIYLNGKYTICRDGYSWKDIKKKRDISAYTVAELGDMLPREFDYKVNEHGKRSLSLSSGKTIIDEGWYLLYSDPHPANKVPIYSQHDSTEANTRAKMTIYLIENDLWTPTNYKLIP